MPERAISLASALLVHSILVAMFAAAMLSGVHTAAFAAGDCLDNPDLRIRDPGHWFYRFDRTQNRQCWHFEPATATTTATTAVAPPLPPPAPAPAANDNTPQALLSRFAAGLSETLSAPSVPPPSPPPSLQQNTAPDTSGNAQQDNAPRPPRRNKIAHQDRPQAAPPPTTTGAAPAADHRDQPPPDKRDPPINVADREALYQDFMKWQMERTVFGRP